MKTKEKTAARGYGAKHQQKRRVWAKRIATGEVVNCARCARPILPGMLWDLGHLDGSGKREYSGPEHRGCNRSTMTHKVKRGRRTQVAYAEETTYRKVSRDW